MKIAGVIAGIVIFAFLAGTVDYFGLLFQSLENKNLKAENEILKRQLQLVETKVTSLETSLERVKTFTTKLELITNINAQDRITKLSTNVKPQPGQQLDDYEPMDKRAPPETWSEEDSKMVEQAPVAAYKGEVAGEKSLEDYSTLVVRIDKAVKETQLKEQSIIELWESLSERQSLLNGTPSIKPAKGWITSRFGFRVNPVTGRPALHAGLDIAASPGSPVYAPADGIVSFAAYDDTYGKLVSIDHGYGVSTRFAHNSQIYVHVGQRVSKYDVIAAAGNSGRSTGPHVHYEVRINGIPVDPINYILDE